LTKAPIIKWPTRGWASTKSWKEPLPTPIFESRESVMGEGRGNRHTDNQRGGRGDIKYPGNQEDSRKKRRMWGESKVLSIEIEYGWGGNERCCNGSM